MKNSDQSMSHFNEISIDKESNFIRKITNGQNIEDSMDQGEMIGSSGGTPIYRRLHESGHETPVTVVCSNHLELGIEDFVNELEQPPDLYRLDSVSFTSWQPPDTCRYCADQPVFLVV
ncbi:CxxH/CxxC protein [Fodinisporobacter ferrooxydans]|uniref:CxxH/CxxC protein n=1 Tax=Fodinisporobacter ferrooxydans TaxID=2901836 RepID=A0ABY4CMI1_9BACL|nr:CxxH/CxxC protein [Alicyclobacillaceae bacterium MYW30-H2]